jgi:hypothetical protein
MTKQNKFYVGILVVMLVVFVAWHFTADVYHVAAPYQSDEHGFALNYPRSWEIVDSVEAMETFAEHAEEEAEGPPPDVFILSPDRGEFFRPSVIVSVFELEPDEVIREEPVDELLEELLDEFLLDLDEVGSNFGMLAQSFEAVGGQRAMHAAYKLRVKPYDRWFYLRYDSYLVPFKESLYAITFTSTLLEADRYEPIFRKIIESFQFVES